MSIRDKTDIYNYLQSSRDLSESSASSRHESSGSYLFQVSADPLAFLVADASVELGLAVAMLGGGQKAQESGLAVPLYCALYACAPWYKSTGIALKLVHIYSPLSIE